LEDEVGRIAARNSNGENRRVQADVSLLKACFSLLLGSLIVCQPATLFAELQGKRFTLLWRGTRDGFGALDFQGGGDGHASTLTILEETERTIFGGFTPVNWEGRGGDPWPFKGDPSLGSFLFTLKNPHNGVGWPLVQTFATFVFSITAMQTATVPLLALAALT
jgi:hypothetical protein